MTSEMAVRGIISNTLALDVPQLGDLRWWLTTM